MAGAGGPSCVIDNKRNGKEGGAPEGQHAKWEITPGQQQKKGRSPETKAENPIPNQLRGAFLDDDALNVPKIKPFGNFDITRRDNQQEMIAADEKTLLPREGRTPVSSAQTFIGCHHKIQVSFESDNMPPRLRPAMRSP